MGIPRPTGEYAGQMLEPGGWPEADEDTFYDRAQEYNRVLHKVTDVMDSTKHQQVEVFDGGIWSGGAANAANGALGTNLKEMSTLQDYLTTVITWHRHVANLVEQAKSEIGNNVDGAQREIIVLENDTELEPEARELAINELVRATHGANTSLVNEAAEQVLASKNWKPPHNALEDLLHQVIPPTPEIPTLDGPTPGTPIPGPPTPTPFKPTPGGPFDPLNPSNPLNPVVPTPFEPTPGGPFDPLNPSNPLNPVVPTPFEPTPGGPFDPLNPSNPTAPVVPSNPGTVIPSPPPISPVTPTKPSNPVTPVTPTPSPTPTPGDVTPVTPGPGPSPGPDLPPAPGGGPSLPDHGGGSTPLAPSTEPASVKPAHAVDLPTNPGQTTGPSGSHRGDDSSPGMAPAAAGGLPGAARGPSGGLRSGGPSAGTSPTAGSGTAPSAASRAAGSRAPVGHVGKAPVGATPRAASARTAPPPLRPAAPAPTNDADKDKTPPADDVTALPSVPVSAARAARDAVLAATARGDKKDPLRLARRVAAALNAHDSGGGDDYGFFWITAVTTDGDIVVANSYGLAYIPEGVELPTKVHMASADRNVPIDEKANTATYPVMAVQGWAAFHDLKLRAVIGTAEQLANSDAGAPKIILEDDDIPESGKMVGRPRLEVVDPSAAAQLQETDDLHLVDLLPPAPANAKAPDDERHMRWFDLMKPMTSTATGREVAHLRAFHAYAGHCEEIALHQAYGAADAAAQRPAVVDFLYWRHVTSLLDSALATIS